MTQLLLDLGHRPALGREDFLVVPSNEVAVEWIDRWPDWPQPGLALYGAPGAGKTHLTQVWRAASGAVAVAGQDLLSDDPPELLGEARACVVEGAEDLFAAPDEPGEAARDEAQRRLLHLYNTIVQRGGHMVLTGRQAPARWNVDLPDLRSRLAALPAVELGPPDERLIEAVLIKQFADRQLRVDAAVVRYLLRRMERSFVAARALVRAIDEESLRRGQQVTVPLVRQVLARAGIERRDDAPDEA